MKKMEGYAIGQQDFKILRERGAVYVDKTSYIEKIVQSLSQYFFLARPRRFGKSLFLSTLRYFFEGRRELFKGLYIDTIDWNWQPYPVLRLDLNIERYAEPGLLDDVLDNLFNRWERDYGIAEKPSNLSSRFRNIIEAAHEKTGLPVVILVDEYDKPLVGNLNDDGLFEHYRAKLASLYSNFKSSAEHIRLVFLTGVSRFSKLSVFSDLNNLNDITFSDEYADICGITEKELYAYFEEGIRGLGENEGWTYDEAARKLKSNYDGYRFSPKGSEIYNPWSLLNCLDERYIGNYWNYTGMPTIIAEALKKLDSDLKVVFNTRCNRNVLVGMDLKSLDPVPLLYQTGYLTIKDYDRDSGVFRLGIPNKEVSTGLMNTLLPYYVKVKRGLVENTVSNLLISLKTGEPEEFMKCMQAYFAGIPYELHMDNENNFHNAFYILTTLIGIDVKAEVSVSSGRIDLLMKTPRYIYIVELKYDHTAEEALRQINERHYARPYVNDGRKLFKIGASFSSKTRCIKSWLIEE